MGSSNSKSSSSCSYRDNRCNAVRLYDSDAGREARVHHSSDFCDPRDLVNHLQAGDMVQKKGNFLHQWFFSHFAVYVDHGEVIHVVGSGPAKRGALIEVFRGELVRKNNTHDEVLPPQPRPQIVLDARRWLMEEWSYNAMTDNCEHFATLCRYRRKISLQAFGIGDVIAGRVGVGEYLYQTVGRSVKQACDTFFSWAKRKVFGAVASITWGVSGLQEIEY